MTRPARYESENERSERLPVKTELWRQGLPALGFIACAAIYADMRSDRRELTELVRSCVEVNTTLKAELTKHREEVDLMKPSVTELLEDVRAIKAGVTRN